MLNNHNKLGFWQITALVTGNLVGSGVFLCPNALIAFGATTAIMGWIISTIGAILIALVFAKLSNLHPESGGPHAFIKHAFGNKSALIIAWGYWIVSWISNTALAIAATSYISAACGVEFSLVQNFWIEIAIMAFFTALNLLSVSLVGKFEFVITAFKVICLIGIPLAGLPFIDFNNFAPVWETISAPEFGTSINAVLMITLWSFIGVETGTVPASEIENPTQTIYKAIISGTLIAALIYILGSITIMGLLDKNVLEQSQGPYSDIANIIFNGNFSTAIAIIAALCIVGTLNGWILIAGRIASGAASDGLFPKFFMTLGSNSTPQNSIIVSFLCGIPCLLFTLDASLARQFMHIIDLSVTLILVIYLMCTLALLKIYISSKQLNITNACIIFGSLIFIVWACSGAAMQSYIISGLIFASALPLFLWYPQKL